MLNNSDPINLYDFDLQYKVSLPTVEYDYYVHAATPSIISTGSSNASLVSGSTFGGTKLISDNIRKFRNNPSVLHTSSGAVYGRQLFSERNQLEIDAKSELDLDTNYSKAKVSTEILLNDLNTNSIAKVSNPRLFAFAGPRIELNEHFAIGNFVRDGLNGEKIHVKGNPSTIRSYLYPTELTSWLIKLMISPSSENINIGSEISYSMTELATMVSNLTSKKGVLFANQNSEASIYVPSTINAQEILKVTEKVCLEIGLERWIRWLELTKR
jgi:dTDP-glucose 4,6-dehydratase